MDVKKAKFFFNLLPLCGLYFVVSISDAASQPSLQQIVKQQQVMLAQQAAQIRRLSARLDQITHRLAVKHILPRHMPTEREPKPNTHLASSSGYSFVHRVMTYPSQASLIAEATDDAGAQPVTEIGNQKAQLLLFGKISPVFFTASDGKDTNAFFASNDITKSQVSADSLFHPAKNWMIGSNVELDFNLNVSNVVSQTNPNPSQSVYIDKAEAYVISRKLGTVWLGIGDAASANTAYTDFSDTALVARATAGDIGGGLLFRDKATGSLSSIAVNNAVNGLDGLPGEMRVRYDTPNFYGLILSASAVESDQQDVALKFGHMIGATKFAAQLAYTSAQNFNTGTSIPPVQGQEVNGSASVLFPVGISLTGAYGKLFVKQNGRDNADYFYIKPGYQAHFSDVGVTAMSVDMGRYYNFIQNGNYATAYGAQVLQNINPWNLVMYMGYRNFSLNNPGSSYNNLNLFILGALYKF